MSNALPDSGGHYYDADKGGLIAVARRNVANARGELTSGDAGANAVGVAVGFAIGGFVARFVGN